MPEMRHILRVSGQPLHGAAFVAELNRVLMFVSEALDNATGRRGTSTLYSDLEMQGNAIRFNGQPMLSVNPVTQQLQITNNTEVFNAITNEYVSLTEIVNHYGETHNTIAYPLSPTTITLTAAGVNHAAVINNPADVTIQLPQVTASEINKWLDVYRIGTGAVTIRTGGANTIADSTAGGTVYSNVGSHTKISLRCIAAGHWAISSILGTWRTT